MIDGSSPGAFIEELEAILLEAVLSEVGQFF
jgi:hypothetical protein